MEKNSSFNSEVKGVASDIFYRFITDETSGLTTLQFDCSFDECSINQKKEILLKILSFFKNFTNQEREYLIFDVLYQNAMVILTVANKLFYEVCDVDNAFKALELAYDFQTRYINRLNELSCLQKGDYVLTPNVDFNKQNLRWGFINFELSALHKAKVIVDYYKLHKWIQ